MRLLKKTLTLLGKPFYYLIISLVISSSGLMLLSNESVKRIRRVNPQKKLKKRVRNLRSLLKKKLKRLCPRKIKRNKSTTSDLYINPRITLGIVFLSMFVIGAATAITGLNDFLTTLPDVKTLPHVKNEASTKLLSSNGELLYQFYDSINRTPVPLSDIPIVMRLATLAAEDKYFYEHKGVSVRGVATALLDSFNSKRLRGGSTITQQLMKVTFLTSERTLERKLREMALALQSETHFTKDQILEFYLNRISYGGTAYGVEEASRYYFGKSVKDLNLSEAALLAGLSKSPSALSPFQNEVSDAKARRDYILTLMNKNNWISYDEMVMAQNAPVTVKASPVTLKSPHFTMYTGEIIRNYYGEELLNSGGLTVHTTIDLSLQTKVEDALNKELTNLKRLNVKNAAAIVVSVPTGKVLAMAGSKDYFDQGADGNVNVLTQLRQPGSSVKAITYAYALSHGYTPVSVLDDKPVTFVPKYGKSYTPKNYDGKYRGQITLRSALAESRNIPAVRVLAQFGVPQIVSFANELGVTSWTDPKNYGLSLTLGGGDLRLIDLAQVYLTIANMGKKVPLTTISEVKETYNNGITKYNPCYKDSKSQIVKCNEQVIDARVAYQLIDILSDNNARTPAFGARSALLVPNHPEVAVKTGTSNNIRDNVAVGFNQDYLVLVWVGNNDNTPMSSIASGLTGASPIWNSIMSKLLEGKQSVAWTPPANMIASPSCSKRVEWFLSENAPSDNCIRADVQREKKQQTVLPLL